MTILLGNAVAMIGCVLMVLVGFLRKKEQILTVQCFQFGFLAAGNLILGGVTGFICGVVSIIRNIVFGKTGGSLKLKLLFIAIQTALTFMSGWPGWLELLPLISGVMLTWFLDLENELHFKFVLIITQITWVIYDWCYLNFVSFTFDIFTILSNMFSVWVILKKAKKEKAPLE